METASDKWSRLLITAIWTYSEKLWRFWNQVVHGRTEVNTTSKEMQQLRVRADALYWQFESDPHMILSSWNYRDRLTAEALKRTLHHFFSKKTTCKNRPVKKSSIWHPPFSNNYYIHHKSFRDLNPKSALHQVTKQRITLQKGKQKAAAT